MKAKGSSQDGCSTWWSHQIIGKWYFASNLFNKGGCTFCIQAMQECIENSVSYIMWLENLMAMFSFGTNYQIILNFTTCRLWNVHTKQALEDKQTWKNEGFQPRTLMMSSSYTPSRISSRLKWQSNTNLLASPKWKLKFAKNFVCFLVL